LNTLDENSTALSNQIYHI
jgi:hypothetical protein